MASVAQFIERDSCREALFMGYRPINRAVDAINVVPTTYPYYFVNVHNRSLQTAGGTIPLS